jgi:four helix bundle protein
MAKIERFEDIQAWQKARELNRQIYAVTGQGNFARDFTLKDQIRRAAISIMLNIAEGFARKTCKEFTRFLFIAHGSAAEVQAALYVALDQNYITAPEFNSLYHHTEEISKMIAGFIKYLGQTDKYS